MVLSHYNPPKLYSARRGPVSGGSRFVRVLLAIGTILVVTQVASTALADTLFRKAQYRRSDSNGDGLTDISDAIRTLNTLFTSSTPEPQCVDALNANGDDAIDISDAIFTIGYLFSSNDFQIPPPGPVECGLPDVPGPFSCDSYDMCPDDTQLIVHALNRITYGPTEALLTEIQTKDDLVDYINSQLDDVPLNYDPDVHEPLVALATDSLSIGFQPDFLSAGGPVERLEGMLVANGLLSEWQLLHVVSQFWNNHFHSQLEAQREQFFRRDQRGGRARRGDLEIFNAVDSDASGAIDETEWTLYRALHPSFRPWNSIGRSLLDDAVTPNLVSLDEFDGFQVAYWKYARNNDQRAVAADMEKREYEFYRRNAFGSFSSLLAACAKSVTMLIYLNNFENVATEPNENYSREYFELQSIGADVVYTQNDIEELARVFTGWTVGWARRADFQPTDLNFMNNPAADTFAINQREPVSAPFNFPTAENWDDSIYTWAFVFRPTQDHDWGEKILFDQTFGGVDSLGNPLDSSARLVLPARSPPGTSGQVAAAILEEFQLVHDRVNGFRDTAKYIVRKLIQKFVVDDLSTLPKAPGRPIPTEVQDGFDLADDNGDGEITLAEWAIPIPFVLPNGRPTSIFQRLDENDDDILTITEYREPDLLLDAIDIWQSTDGNLREVLRTIFLSDEFLSLDFYRAKVKTPFESTLSAMRAVNGLPTPNDLRDIAADLQLSGMELFDFADPTGESELGFDWMHTIGLLERLRLINRGVNPSSNGDVRFSWDPLGIQTAWQLGNGVASVDYLQLVLYGGDLLGEHRQLAIEAYNNPTNSIFSTSEWPMRSATAFLLSLPQFQKQ